MTTLHVAIATRSFRRHATYRTATLAGLFTNSVFGIIIAFTYLAVWEQSPTAGGYDATDAVTYAWLGQAMIMTVAVWGGGATDELAERISNGDVAVDLYRPVSLLGWYVAADLGRAAYHLLSRGIGPILVGSVLFDLRYPGGPWAWVAVAASIPLAVLVSCALRMLVATTTFWLLDPVGARNASAVLAMFFSGLTVPLVLLPGWFGEVARALPWAAFLQVPADLWLGQRTGWDAVAGLALQAAWAAVLLVAAALLLRTAERRVVLQGG